MFVDMAFVKNPLKLNIKIAARNWWMMVDDGG